MEVEQSSSQTDVTDVLSALLSDFGAITDYRMLRDSLPRRLAALLQCRCVLLYLRVEETLQLASGSFDDVPGWSSALLAVAHVNPIHAQSDLPEARAWRERKMISVPAHRPALLAVPLLYRHRSIGVLVAIRGQDDGKPEAPIYWSHDMTPFMSATAGVVALLLENTRLLERDRERIHELSLLNSMSSQMHSSTYEYERLRSIVLQRTREISNVDLCDLLLPSSPEDVTWISPHLAKLLFSRFQEQSSLSPIVVERITDGYNEYATNYFEHLPPNVKTFFAMPLLSSRVSGRTPLRSHMDVTHEVSQVPRVLGCVIGCYYRPWKMKHAEVALLQVLANQASAVLENMRLMEEVLDARNRARELLEQVLDDQQSKELILSSIPSGLIATDEYGRITMFNRAAEVLFGYHPSEVLGQPLHKFLVLKSVYSADNVLDLPPPQSPALVAMHTGEPQHHTVLASDRYDRELFLDVDVRPLYNNEDKQAGTLITFTDVTSMHHLEEEKRRLDRLASLGEMAASVAHEVRNPLASIKTSVQLLRDEIVMEQQQLTEQFQFMLESANVVLQEVNRLDTIVRDLLLFAKPRQLHRTGCNIQELLEHVLQMVQRQCADGHVQVHRVFEHLPTIWLDMGQMEQVLLNLLLNAVQAMSDGGTVTVTCHCISAEQAIYDTAGSHCPPTQRPSGASGTAVSAYAWLIDKHATQKEFRVQQWLEISISDTGIGIAEDQLKYIFQPFYTTKAHGIGLGLAITRRLVEDHGGYLRIDSQFGTGTTVSVRLPFVVLEMREHESSDSNY